ncbi:MULTISPECIES: hypothetical protein [Cupriavidus]|jgi:hypothetical protein|uniref:Uncharacterized protein n=1 Tax=Cupriavidus metallidurans TaxID=119219 RepID=A0A482IN78_9BURK|nr:MULTISPECIES: hypothetical protein [Cupriavidus]KWR78465.1 hypothetical protein RN01_23665 [Cupriavidus sp. SHE]QBP09631.1 hypothetical protein DDF84_007580 [Cupriavidus metallidurans]QWC89981.1 hypothetical protein KB891_07260 [Cupriavidus metallidurans]
MSDAINRDLRLLAAIAYGEASTANDSDEIGGIAFSVANRCRAWRGKTASELRVVDPNYAFAWSGSNQRFNKLMSTHDDKLDADAGIKVAVEWARKALANEGRDPSNGAFWWDGLDFKTEFATHPKAQIGFKWGDPSHNIFGVPENKRLFVKRWRVVNKRTGKIVDGAERGRYDSVWVSTAAHGSTIFWTLNPDYVKATGAKAYR